MFYIFNYLKFKAEWVLENNRPPKEWPSSGVIKFDRYSVKYREDLDFVLKSIDAQIKPGEKVI